MTFKDGSFSLAVIERMIDLFSPTRGWTQRLWRSSPIDTVKHCLDLVEGDARDGAKTVALGEARSRITGDLFIPPRDRGGVLKQLNINADRLGRGSSVYFALKSLSIELEQKYSGWVLAFLDSLDEDIDVPSSPVSGEKLAWQLTAFLRSEGMSDIWIANFASYHLRHNKNETTLAATIRLALQVSSNEPGFTFFLPLTKRKGFNLQAAPLLKKPEFEKRFNQLLPGVQVPENYGGLEIYVETIDKYAAIEELQLVINRVIERHRISQSKRQFILAPEAWVSPGSWSTTVSLEREPRVQVRELDSGGGSEMFARVSEELEAALDLLTAADRTSARAATIAAWATLETLFANESDYGDLAVVADRAADILICVYVRDVFNGLATGHARAKSDKLSSELELASEAQAAILVEQALPAHPMSVKSGRGQIARERAVILNSQEVNSVRTEFVSVFRRLYSTRNQIVHAGRMAPFGLHRTYEESAVLLSALLDELIRENRETGRTAREVAGRAAWLIGRLTGGRATPASLAELGDK